MKIRDMTKVQLITNIVNRNPTYVDRVGRLYSKDIHTLRRVLMRLVKENVMREMLCPVCHHKEEYDEHEIKCDKFGEYIVCHKCGVKMRLQDEDIQVRVQR